MDKIRKIIKEEINRFILTENIGTLQQDATRLNGQLNQMSNDMSRVNYQSLDKRLQRYLKEFETYVLQVIFAVNRCVKANSLNEAYGGWGINVPPELGGNFWNDAKRGYYATKNFLTRGRYNNYYNNNSKVNRNSIPSVKLSQLLYVLPQKETEFNRYDSTFGISNTTNQPRQIFGTLTNLKQKYDALVAQQQQQQNQNAQGTNP